MRRLLLAAIAGAVLLIAPIADASNMAYLAKHTIAYNSGGNNWHEISIPFNFSPPEVDAVNWPGVDAEDLARSLQPTDGSAVYPCTGADCLIKNVLYWDNTTGDMVTWAVGTPSFLGTPFLIVPGRSYFIDIKDSGDTDNAYLVAGSNDPSLTLNQCYNDGGNNWFFLSLPHSVKIAEASGYPAGLDSEDVCQALSTGNTPIKNILAWDNTAGDLTTWACGTPSFLGTPFTVDPTDGLAIDINCTAGTKDCANCTWSWDPTHY